MWFYKNIEVTPELYQQYREEGFIGFVYVVTDNVNGMKYLGKKLWVSTRKLAPLKGQKRKRTKVVETDWMTYYGSSEEVQKLVQEHGDKRFSREILQLCKTKGELNYVEAMLQFKLEVLLHSEVWYNGISQCKIHRNHAKSVQKTLDYKKKDDTK